MDEYGRILEFPAYSKRYMELQECIMITDCRYWLRYPMTYEQWEIRNYMNDLESMSNIEIERHKNGMREELSNSDNPSQIIDCICDYVLRKKRIESCRSNNRRMVKHLWT